MGVLMSLEAGFWRIQNNRPTRIAPTVMGIDDECLQHRRADV
jgi:hypothetical protein